MALVKGLACHACDVEVLDVHRATVAERAWGYGVRFVPAVVVDGRRVGCSTGPRPDADTLRAAGLGRRWDAALGERPRTVGPPEARKTRRVAWQRAWSTVKVVVTAYWGTQVSSEDEAVRIIRQLTEAERHRVAQRLRDADDEDAARWITENGERIG